MASLRNKIRLFTLFAAVLVNLVNSAVPNPRVKVSQGELEGAVLPRDGGKTYFSFKGIPYATAQRFAPPQPAAPWTGVRQAKDHGPKCTQFNVIAQKILPGSEDCLSLNVYTNSLKPETKAAVMVFLHGGSYMYGAGDADSLLDSSFGPEHFLQHDVVIVTINYRLEVLGFLSLDTPEAPGNNGMKDQVAALRWVKENIAKFGGDPDNVTLFGESSGSASVTLHIQSPISKGLFQKAIAESGVSIVDWAVGRTGKDRALRAAKHLGSNEQDPAKVLQFLRGLPATNLTGLTAVTITEDEKNRGIAEHFAPVIEKKFPNVEAFITEEPIAALTGGRMNNVPLMIGYNADENLLLLTDVLSKVDFTNKNLQYLLPREIAQKVPLEKSKEFGKRLRDFYVGNREFTKEDRQALVDLFTDKDYLYSTHRFIHYYSKLAKTFLYKFSCDTALNAVKITFGLNRYNVSGPLHGDELFYMFSNHYNKDAYNKDPKLQDIVFKMTKLWTDFAKNSDPTPGQAPTKWLPYTSAQKSFYDINMDIKAGVNPDQPRVDAWDQLHCEAGVPCIAK